MHIGSSGPRRPVKPEVHVSSGVRRPTIVVDRRNGQGLGPWPAPRRSPDAAATAAEQIGGRISVPLMVSSGVPNQLGTAAT